MQTSARTLAGRISGLTLLDGRRGAVVAVEDVTELRRLTEQVERTDRLKALGEMAAGVAHEIRNPLNGIEGFASLLARDCEEGSSSRRYAEAVIDGVRHLNTTVTSLLAFTSPQPPQKRAVPIVELVQSCIELVDAEDVDDDAHPPQIELVVTWDGERVPCDGSQVRQVVLNIIKNAVSIEVDANAGSTRESDVGVYQADLVERLNGPPRVRCTVAGHCNDAGEEYVHIIVDDAGPGVPESSRSDIFTPFFTTRVNGTGLGLAVAHTIVELHGGTLAVEDAPSDYAGARFTISLPLI